ncbi:hypothetical protein MD484_g6201, partial [Candolleomyces efflorescens]
MPVPLSAVRSSSDLRAWRADAYGIALLAASSMVLAHGLDLGHSAFDQEYNRLCCEAIMSSYTGKPSETLCTKGPYYTEKEILSINREQGIFKFMRPVMIRRDCLVGPHHIKIGQDGFAFVNTDLAKNAGTFGALEAYSLEYKAEWTGPQLDDQMFFRRHSVTLFLEGRAMPGYFKYMGTFYLRLFRNVNLDIVSNPAFSTFDNDQFKDRVNGVTAEERGKCPYGAPLLIVQAAKDLWDANPFKMELVA